MAAVQLPPHLVENHANSQRAGFNSGEKTPDTGILHDMDASDNLGIREYIIHELAEGPMLQKVCIDIFEMLFGEKGVANGDQ